MGCEGGPVVISGNYCSIFITAINCSIFSHCSSNYCSIIIGSIFNPYQVIVRHLSPLKTSKTWTFLRFLGVIEREHQPKMDLNDCPKGETEEGISTGENLSNKRNVLSQIVQT